ncbi:MAG: aldo/keto reductase [Opitutales bacterium]
MTTRLQIPGLTPYVYGTTRLGDASIPFAARVAIAREAMNTGVWFHTSTQYGDALQVLRAAFDEDRANVPHIFYKIQADSLDGFKKAVHEHIDVLGLDHMDVGQLCLGGEYAENFARTGKGLEDFRALKDEGLVRNFVLEVFPWTSANPLAALKAGYTDELISAFIFYLNPLQRFVSNILWDTILEKKAPIVAMRTVSGGNVHRLRDVPGAAWKDYLRARAVEVAPIFERSGIASWTEFCVRFAHSLPNVLATVGSSSRSAGLKEFTDAIKGGAIKPLPQDIVDDILALQRRWSDETDVHAEPWSM